MPKFAVVEKPLDWFTENPTNYRAHPDDQVEQIRASLRQLGVFKNVVARPDGTLLAGHGVLAAARAEGLATLPVHVFEGTDAEARKLLVADNELSRMAEDDEAQLASLLRDLQEDDELEGTGYDEAALDGLLESLGDNGSEPPEDPGPSDPLPEAITRPGDLWLLGEHRVVCGDCTEATVWERLFGDERARMTWTDPPYGVSYADKNKFLNALDRGNRIQDPIAHDHMDEEQTEALCRDALTMAAAHSEPGASAYVACPAGTLLPHFIAAVAASGFEYRHSLAWVKNQFVLGRCDYHYRHETILYGWKTDAAHYFVDDHGHDSVFEVSKPHQSKLHPTQKPVELVAQMVANSSRKGETVADPFLGSGTTLIAAEQLGRRCYGIEIEPRYVDVTIRRWQEMTGREATLESTGQTFVEAGG